MMQDIMTGVTITPDSSLRKFCGSCGTCFEDGQLLPSFKFCMHCGGDLAPWLIKAISGGIPPATPPMTPSTNPQVDRSLASDQEMEDMNVDGSGGSTASPSGGRGQ